MSIINPLILQAFEWHTASTNGSHYSLLTRLLPTFAHLGVTSIWLPPGCKANNPQGNGYDIYDLWDLGEFEQKGCRSTKWGSRDELDLLLKQAKESSIDIIWDAVLNHKAGADATEEVWAVEVDKEDRRYEICPPKKIEAWLQFDFHGRQQEDGSLKYSDMRWRANGFNGTDWDHRSKKNSIYRLIDDPATLTKPFTPPKRQPNRSQSTGRSLSKIFRRFSSDSAKISKSDPKPAQRPGKGWAEDVDSENGNADYLMFSNIDYTQQRIREDVIKWGEWMVNEVGVTGFRLDAVQHFSYNFTRDWIRHVNDIYQENNGRSVFVVGEVWRDLSSISAWLAAVQHPSHGPQIYAYDAPLLYNFSRISEDIRQRSKNTDLRTVLRNSLVNSRPEAAVTLVTNHDTQPGQTCYTPMHRSLKLLWYAFILLRREGIPCVFWGDAFGTQGPHAEPPIGTERDETQQEPNSMSEMLAKLILCRKHFAHGEQVDYWQSASLIGWTRKGLQGGSGCAVVMSVPNTSKSINTIQMLVGAPRDVWVKIGHPRSEVTIDAKGFGAFATAHSGLSIWVRKGTEVVLDIPQRQIRTT